jgi:hypothetical protein
VRADAEHKQMFSRILILVQNYHIENAQNFEFPASFRHNTFIPLPISLIIPLPIPLPIPPTPPPLGLKACHGRSVLVRFKRFNFKLYVLRI